MLNDFGFAVELLGELKWENFLKRPFAVEAIRMTKEKGPDMESMEESQLNTGSTLFFCPEGQEKHGAYEFMVDISPNGELYFTMQHDDTVVLSVYSDKTVEIRTAQHGSWVELPHDIISDHSTPEKQEIELLDFTYPKWRDDLKHAGMVVKLGMMLFDSLVGPDGHFKEGTMDTY